MKRAAALACALYAAGAAGQEDPPAAVPPPPPSLVALWKSVKKDGPIELTEAARKDLAAHLPAASRGEQCEEAATVQQSAVALKDRGDGPLVVAMLHTCRGETAFAFAPGTPVRVSKLFDNEGGQRLMDAMALPLRPGPGNEDVGLVLAAQTSELRLFARRADTGFSFHLDGALADLGFIGQCDEDPDHVLGYQSYIKVDASRRVLRLRIEARCGGGTASAACEVWRLAGGELQKAGACALPSKLDEPALRAAGFR